MAQNKSQSGAQASSDSIEPVNNLTSSLDPSVKLGFWGPAPTAVTIELLRRPTDNGAFGTISFKVAITGASPEEALRLLDEMTTKLETQYGSGAKFKYSYP